MTLFGKSTATIEAPVIDHDLQRWRLVEGMFIDGLRAAAYGNSRQLPDDRELHRLAENAARTYTQDENAIQQTIARLLGG